MNPVCPIPARPKIGVRPMAWRDLPQLLQMARQVGLPAWVSADFRTLMRSGETMGCVAEIQSHIAGFVMCTVFHRARPAGGVLRRLLRLGFWLVGRHSTSLSVNLVDVIVAPDWPRADIEHALLWRLDRELRRSSPCIRIVVPETNLAAQLFLREAGYRATRVLHGYYGDEDGYLLVRQQSGNASQSMAAGERNSRRTIGTDPDSRSA